MKYVQATGKIVRIYAAKEDENIFATAQVVIDRSSSGLTTWEIPRGPLWNSGEDEAVKMLCKKILGDAKASRVISVYFSPIIELPFPLAGAKFSERHVQGEATRIVDLRLSEAEILAQMHPKGRYNIKVAEKSGAEVLESKDTKTFYELLHETGVRDKFGILPESRYKTFLDTIPGSFLLLAYAHGIPAAGLLGVKYGTTGIYYYGASSYQFRSLMAPYALQWAAMKHCKENGCIAYDLLGVAPPNSSETHPWAKISDFKAKFGGSIITYPPEQEVVLRPGVQTLLNLKRRLVG